MKPLLKILIIFFLIALLLAVIFFVFGNQVESFFSQDRCVNWFSTHKHIAWGGSILLLLSDIILPVPASGIMAATGTVYGLWVGALTNFFGSVCAGLVGYGAARLPGQRFARCIATDDELNRFKVFFDQWGAYAVIISRALPIMPEAVSILAGISKMSFTKFFLSLSAGTLPVSVLFSWMGAYSSFSHSFGIAAAVLIPALIWPVFIKIVKI